MDEITDRAHSVAWAMMSHRAVVAAVRVAPSAIIFRSVVVLSDDASNARMRSAYVLVEAAAAELDRQALATCDERHPRIIVVIPACSSLALPEVFRSVQPCSPLQHARDIVAEVASIFHRQW